ncbi:TetR/AcrR family transcriptional regulator [Bacillus sp. M6-12]|uniref:TetR/AcrR family transcriptional regulator n=1 Tax=Bacillus sp. M6-12 TaxID=2054166 RepID=UPI0015E0ABAF|nr:TetR/AcrR family transcriptional regulator [Bacillus sp. M6-12]
MQILKKEKQLAIMNAAVDEFFEKGFARASIRNIAQNANVSTGNLYRYYKNKESLFESITKPLAGDIELLFALPVKHPGGSVDLKDALQILNGPFISLLIENRKLLLILYDGSDGTPAARFKEDWKHAISQLFLMYISIYNHKFPAAPFDIRIANSASTSFLEGLMQIVREYEDPEDIKSLTMEIFRLYFYWRISED